MKTSGSLFDGEIAKAQKLEISLSSGLLVLTDNDSRVSRQWYYSEIIVVENPDSGAGLVLSHKKTPKVRLYIEDNGFWKSLSRKLQKNTAVWSGTGHGWGEISIYALLCVGFCAIVYASFNTIVETAARWVPDYAMTAIGDLVFDEMTAGYEICEQKEGMEVLENLTTALSVSDPRAIDYNVSVIQSKPYEFGNAFAMPGYNILIHSALIDEAETIDEIAAILAHEMGHIQLYHIEEKLVRQAGLSISIAMVLGDLGAMADIASLAAHFGQMHFSREDEMEADLFSQKALYVAGFSPKALNLFF